MSYVRVIVSKTEVFVVQSGTVFFSQKRETPEPEFEHIDYDEAVNQAKICAFNLACKGVKCGVALIIDPAATEAKIFDGEFENRF